MPVDRRQRTVAVLGAGSWGTALANHLAANSTTILWARSDKVAEEISQKRQNHSFLPNVTLHPALQSTSDFEAAVAPSTDVLVCVPSSAFKDIVRRVVELRPTGVNLIWACKGLDPQSGRFLSDYLDECLPEQSRYAIVSGPTFASELALGLPTAITTAASDSTYASEVAELLHTERLRVYTSTDINGVQFGGALKNVYAIAAGISDGLGFGANARVALVTRGLAELMRMAESLQIRRDTLMGLAGVGDLILTCTDNQSRNRRFGLALADGLSINEARRSVGQVVEGIAAIRAAHQLSAKLNIEMPIVEQLFEVIENGKAPTLAVQTLLSRKQRDESG